MMYCYGFIMLLIFRIPLKMHGEILYDIANPSKLQALANSMASPTNSINKSFKNSEMLMIVI